MRVDPTKWFLGVALAAERTGATANAQEARAVVDQRTKAIGGLTDAKGRERIRIHTGPQEGPRVEVVRPERPRGDDPAKQL